MFCDENHNTFGELASYYNCHNSSKKITLQSQWKKSEKDLLWQKIVKNKIMNQMLMLEKIKSDSVSLLMSYVEEVSVGDKTNREAHAAKVYFNSLFTKKFIRNSDDEINAMLNYGYAVLLSTVNKEVLINGYVTQLGINHKSEFNSFNLSCDLMEPFRIIIDNYVYYNNEKEFDSNFKLGLVNLFNGKYKYNGKMYVLKDIINLYVKNTLLTIEGESEYKDFIFYEG